MDMLCFIFKYYDSHNELKYNMRIWSLHPKYLDSKGLVALWRESLLAQNVLMGNTKGYKNHPQLLRFKSQKDPINAIGVYLSEVYNEATCRNYNFDKSKIVNNIISANKIALNEGQLKYELEHLKRKLQTRDPKKYKLILNSTLPEHHPLFYIKKGDIEPWEVITVKKIGSSLIQ